MYNVPVCFFLLAELLAFNCTLHTEENTHVPGYMIHLSAKIQYSSTVNNLDMYYIHGTHMYVNK